MGSARSAVVALCLAATLVTTLTVPDPATAARDPGVTTWSRPVPGRVVHGFDPPRSVYGSGHRGVDFAATPLTTVVAAGPGRVAFSGRIGDGFHVSIAHGGGVVSTVSFLAAVTVRTGATVARGQALGVTGGTGPGHDGTTLHFGVRLRGRYVDPMRLFAAVDLAGVVRLAPVRHQPDQAGLITRVSEARELAQSLHIPAGIPGLEPEEEANWWERAMGFSAEVLGAGPRFVGAVWELEIEAGRRILGGAHYLVKRSPLGPLIEDTRTMSARLVDYIESRSDCTAADDAAPGPGGGGSGHLLFAVAGINSSTDPETGRAYALDIDALGYRESEVGWFSYRADGGSYRAEDTYGDLVTQAYRLRDQLREFSAAHPGREVDLIAHSQGGVVVDAFLQLIYDPADPTLPPMGTVVTLASPHQGAPGADVGQIIGSTNSGRALLDGLERLAGGAIPPARGVSTRQLASDSRLMATLRRRGLPDQVELTSIGAGMDPVVPASVTHKRGARSVTVDPDGLSEHSSIVHDATSMRAARLVLEGRPAPCVGWVEGLRGAVQPVVIRRVEVGLGHAVDSVLRGEVPGSPHAWARQLFQPVP